MKQLVTKIGRAFAAGSRAASGDLNVGGLAPADIVASKVLELLQANEVLDEIFSGRIERPVAAAPWDARDLPRLKVYPAVAEGPQAPTQLELQNVQVVIAVVMNAGEMPTLAAWEPGLSTLSAYINQVLRADRTLLEQINGVSDVPLAMEGNPGADQLYIDPVAEPRRQAVLFIPWTYRVDVDQRDGKIANVKAAGG